MRCLLILSLEASMQLGKSFLAQGILRARMSRINFSKTLIFHKAVETWLTSTIGTATSATITAKPSRANSFPNLNTRVLKAIKSHSAVDRFPNHWCRQFLILKARSTA